MAQFIYPGMGEVVPYAYENITVSTGSIGFTATVIRQQLISQTTAINRLAKTAFVTVEGNPVRVRWDGGAPVAGTSGHLLNPGDSIEFVGETTIPKVRFIRDTGVDGTVRVTYGRTA